MKTPAKNSMLFAPKERQAALADIFLFILNRRALRRAGEILTGMQKAKGSAGTMDGKDISGGCRLQPPEDNTPTYADLGIEKRRAGEILTGMQKAKGELYQGDVLLSRLQPATTGNTPTYADLGIEKRRAGEILTGMQKAKGGTTLSGAQLYWLQPATSRGNLRRPGDREARCPNTPSSVAGNLLPIGNKSRSAGRGIEKHGARDS
jgi:hypothetical protein